MTLARAASASGEIHDHSPATIVEMVPRPVERFVIALVGLAFEARIAAGPGVFVICRNTESGVAASIDDANSGYALARRTAARTATHSPCPLIRFGATTNHVSMHS